MKRSFALVVAVLFVAINPLRAATAEFHATHGKPPKERTVSPKLTGQSYRLKDAVTKRQKAKTSAE